MIRDGFPLGVYLILAFFHTSSCQLTQNIPPRITSHPPTEISYKVGEPTTLQCEADGRPSPRYEWRKGDEELVVDGSRIRWKIPDQGGTIVINEPTISDEGEYQCFAKNDYGAAISIKMHLKKAVLEPFPSIKQPRTHRPYVGSKFTLTCEPPKSYPPGLIYWGENKPGSRLKPIENTNRISSDYNGNLHFSNVQPEDYQNGFSYICIVQNAALRSLVQGDDQIIYPNNLTEKSRYESPHLMWSSLTKTVAIRGQTLRMKCIFSGYPTPDVSWQRVDTTMSQAAEFPSFGQEIVIRNVQFDDEGDYRCSATNSDGVPVTKDFKVVVESTPYWRQDRPPEDVNVSEDEPAHIQCLPDGKPRPSVSWFINGKPIEEVPPDPRRTVGDHMISYSSVTKADIQVIQCNASNTHGYILVNTFINVLAERPSFTRTPKPLVKVAEGTNVTLICRVFGAPKPNIVWKYSRAGQPERVVTNGRFSHQSSGDLWIKVAARNDSGKYSCQATNKFGNDTVSGELIVRERTVITTTPRDQVVTASSVVVFPCTTKTDPAEASELVIEWRRNGEKLDLRLRPHMEHNRDNNSLIITGVEASDSANYTCHASNGVDSAEATARLVVQDRPDPPSSVWLESSCLDLKADVRWTPGNDNNDRITEYHIYSNTSHDPPDRFRRLVSVPGSVSTMSALLNLQPWTSYSFHVTARNSFGESRRSGFTTDTTNCTTPANFPFRDPDNICTVSRKDDELVIVWQPIEPADQNGDNFHYVVGYRRRGESETKYEKIKNWRTNELVIPNQPTFAMYEIFVKSVNIKGEAPFTNLSRKIGYSGQGIPLTKPDNFTVQSFNSSSATFRWKGVGDHPDEIRGFFLGYRIEFWKTDKRDDVRKEDVILRSVDSCPTEGRVRRNVENDGDDFVTGVTNRLWAHSDVTATVMVLNGAHNTGPCSNTVQFTTPEGVPEPVSKFEVTERGSNHFVVSWDPPKETNGVLTGYLIEFEEAPIGAILVKTNVDPSKNRHKITGLGNDTNYVVHIRAQTSAGNGQEIQLLEKTNPASVPNKPGVSDLEAGDDFVVVSWKPSTADESTKNPGSTYCVEYRAHGSNEWLRTNNMTDGQINVTGLDKGVKYEVRVVAFNDDERYSASDTVEATTGPKLEDTAEPVQSTQSYLYMIVIAASLFLVVFILCIFCYASHNRGEAYSVNKREKMHGCAAGKDDEPEFGEYVRPQEPYAAKNKVGSLDSLTAKKALDPVDSDIDSLGEYADPDPSKFNEDGSFIGQYGNKKPPATDGQPNAAVFSTYI